MNKALKAYADSIPCLGKGGKEIWKHLVGHARKVKEGSCIVEIGPFLGSGTGYLALGILENKAHPTIYAIDPWKTGPYIEKAKKFLGIDLEGEDAIYEGFIRNTAPFGVKIKKIRSTFEDLPIWTKEPIGLVVMDAGSSKTQMEHFHNIILPRLIYGAVVILEDFYFYETHQGSTFLEEKKYMESHACIFQFMYRDGVAAFFKYTGEEKAPKIWASHKRTICEVLREIGDLHQDEQTMALLLEATGMAKKMARKLLEYNKDVFADWWAKNPDYEEDVKRRMNDDQNPKA